MASDKRTGNGFFSSRYFGLFLGLIIFLIIGSVYTIGLFDPVENKTTDVHFRIKKFLMEGERIFGSTRTQENISVTSGSGGILRSSISDDIVIVGIDNRTLSDLGRWPFNRAHHADLLNVISGIGDQNRRESVTFLDFLFFNTAEPAYGDVLLLDAIENHGSVLLQNQLFSLPVLGVAEDTSERMDKLLTNLGELESIGGAIENLPPLYGVEAPLIPYTDAISSYGYANYGSDSDDIFRRAIMVSAYSEVLEEFLIEDINLDTEFAVENKGHLAFLDKNGYARKFHLPLNADDLEKLRESISRLGVERSQNRGDYYVTVYEDHYLPSTSLSLALKYFNKDFEDVTVEIGSHILIRSPMEWNASEGVWTDLKVADGRNGATRVLNEIRIPIDSEGQMLINFVGSRSSTNSDRSTFPVRSYTSIVKIKEKDRIPATLGWDGNVVMVGAFTNAMADDEKLTPMGLMFGVEMQANALNTIIQSNFITNVSVWLNLLFLFLMVAVIAFVTTGTKKTGWSAVIFVLTLFATFVTVSLLFSYQNLLIDWFTAALASAITFVVIVVYQVLSLEQHNRQITSVFGQFVSPSVVEELISTNELPELGGENRDVTIFFSDIRDFSGLAERKPNPQDLVDILNRYLTEMTDNIVVNFDGTLDKYIGDAIMAIWGAPIEMNWEEHAVRACKSALMQIELLEKMNTRLKEEALPDTSADHLEIGIGIHSGECMVGYMGSEKTKNYTAMGDNVNISSRLEGVNKQYATRILISEDTRERIAKEPFIVRELDLIRVKGRDEPFTIYELVDYEGELYTAPENTAKGRKGSR